MLPGAAWASQEIRVACWLPQSLAASPLRLGPVNGAAIIPQIACRQLPSPDVVQWHLHLVNGAARVPEMASGQLPSPAAVRWHPGLVNGAARGLTGISALQHRTWAWALSVT